MSAKRGLGTMGKSAFWGIVAAATLFALPAHAKKPKLATVLPSRVKTITLRPSKSHKSPAAPKSSRAKKRTSARTSARTAPVEKKPDDSRFAPELREIPASFKIYKSAVRYVRSDVRLSSDYDCDQEALEQKKAEAEANALAECEARGIDGCRIAGSLIAKNGELRCSDFPGGRCPARGHFRGCVGQALAVGREVEAPTAPAASADTDDLAGL